jgi:hypothetical protein
MRDPVPYNGHVNACQFLYVYLDSSTLMVFIGTE